MQSRQRGLGGAAGEDSAPSLEVDPRRRGPPAKANAVEEDQPLVGTDLEERGGCDGWSAARVSSSRSLEGASANGASNPLARRKCDDAQGGAERAQR